MLQDRLQELLDRLEQLPEERYIVKNEEYSPHSLHTSFIENDLTTVIHLDLSCRLSLWPVQKIVQEIKTPKGADANFKQTAIHLLELLQASAEDDKEIYSVYQTISSILSSSEHFALQDMFITTSLMILLVTTTIYRLTPKKQRQAMNELDTLLRFKLNQLRYLSVLLTGESDSEQYS